MHYFKITYLYILRLFFKFKSLKNIKNNINKTSIIMMRTKNNIQLDSLEIIFTLLPFLIYKMNIFNKK